MNAKRNDKHTPSNLIPADYTHVLCFAFPGNGEPGIGLKELEDLRAKEAFFSKPNGTGGCHVCGAHFRYGSVFRHNSGEHIVVGWECADKIDSGIDRNGVMLELARAKQTLRQQRWEAQNQQLAIEFLNAHPGLSEALAHNHNISQDLNAQLKKWGRLSEAQVNLAFKLVADSKRPVKAKVNVPAGEGRRVIVGTVISTKVVDSDFGSTLKMVVEVDAEGGAYRLWGTVPASLGRPQSGTRVTFEAAVQKSRDDASFGFFSRPSKARALEAV